MIFRVNNCIDLKINDNPDALSRLQYPLYGSAKLDGVRAYVRDFTMYSKNNKPIRNFSTQDRFCSAEGLDGELVVGAPNDPMCIRRTMSGVSSYEGEPAATFFVFDLIREETIALPYYKRLTALRKHIENIDCEGVVYLQQTILKSVIDVLEFESAKIREGYEGVVLRAPDGLYRGRGKVKMYKLKRFFDTEAIILGLVPKYTNTNEQVLSERGTMKRSQAKGGLIETNTLGGIKIAWGNEILIVGCGTLTEKERAYIYQNPREFLGKPFTFRYFTYGVNTATGRPRHGRFHSWRTPGY
jgi:DNA ligase-1